MRVASVQRLGEYVMSYTIEQAVNSFESGNPTTQAFAALGLPFEAFLRWSQVSDDRRSELMAMLKRTNYLGKAKGTKRCPVCAQYRFNCYC